MAANYFGRMREDLLAKDAPPKPLDAYATQVKNEAQRREALNSNLQANPSDQPYSLKNFAAIPTQKVQEPQQPTQTAPVPKTPTQSVTDGLTGAGAYDLLFGGSEAAAPATPEVISIGGSQVPNAAPSLAGPLPFGPSAGVVAGTALVGKGVNDLLKGRTDNSTTGKASRLQTGITTGGLSEVARFAGIGGGKGKDQQARDSIRSQLKAANIIDDKYGITLADGSTFNIGVDGGKFAQTSNVNFDTPGAGEVVAMANPLAYLMTGGDKKLASDFAGYLTNAALSNANGDIKLAKANLQAFYDKLGVDKASFMSAIDGLKDVDDETKNIFKADAGKFNYAAGEGSGGGNFPAFGGVTINLPSQPKSIPTPPPVSEVNFGLMDLAQRAPRPEGSRGDVIFSNALKTIYGG